MLVRQKDVAGRYAISLSNLCWLHELIITHRALSNPCVFSFQHTHGQHRAGLMEAVTILGMGVPTVLGTVPRLAS